MLELDQVLELLKMQYQCGGGHASGAGPYAYN